MKKGTIKIGALIGAILITILIVSLATGRSNKNMTTNMQEASLPIVTFYRGDTQINELHGYTDKMDPVFVRDTITPIDNKRILPIHIDTYDAKIDAISYEIRSTNGKRLIAKDELENYSQKDGIISSDIKIQNIIEEDTEYLFVLKLEQEGSNSYYYTRIIQPVDAYVEESVDFVMDFHNKTMNRETGGTLATYLEPDSSADNTSLNKVNIHSSLNQLTWGKLDYEQVSSPVPSVKEISDSVNVITLKYLVTTKGTKNQTEYYNVEEYYRVRYTKDRVYVLNYERTMNQIFRGENDCLYDKYVQLGIRSKNINYVANGNGTVVSFVQEGELWNYNQNTGQLAKVFSFRGDDEIGARENYDQHDIKIVEVDESGSVDFLVYGYMNRGVHEGKVGISVCHYDSVANTTEEELFFPVNTSYQVMKEDLGELVYQNNQNEFYIIAGKNLYQIQMDTLEVAVKKKNLTAGSYVVSKSGRYIAYKQSDTGVLHLEDLETGSVYDMQREGTETLVPLGFMGEDFIYGIAKNADVTEDASGNLITPMYRVEIISSDENHKVLKSYEKGGYYICGLHIDGNTIYLNRAEYQNGSYVEASSDTIMNSEDEENTQVLVHSSTDEEKQTQIQLEFAKENKDSIATLLTPKYIVEEKPKEVDLEFSNNNQYYAYTQGKVIVGSKSLAEVIREADDNMGVVVDAQQNYIWKRTKKTAQGGILSSGLQAEGNSSVSKCLSLMLQKQGITVDTDQLLEKNKTVEKALEESLENIKVLDLSGCKTEEVLYYVNCGNPVLGILGQDLAVLIVGYDTTGIIVYSPNTGSSKKMSFDEANAAFEAAGNIFYSYIELNP